MAKKKEWYVVRKGRATGLFSKWEECKKQVIGFPGAEYKGFYTREEAEQYMGVPIDLRKKTAGPIVHDESVMTVYVDGSYVPFLPDQFSFGAVFLYQGKTECVSKLIVDPDNAQMRNVAGEVAGAMYAMKKCLAMGLSHIELYYDYAGIEKWCTGEWKCNKTGTKALKSYYDSICGALDVSFHKVESHTGVKYNEMADRLAKQALLGK